MLDLYSKDKIKWGVKKQKLKFQQILNQIFYFN